MQCSQLPRLRVLRQTHEYHSLDKKFLNDPGIFDDTLADGPIPEVDAFEAPTILPD